MQLCCIMWISYACTMLMSVVVDEHVHGMMLPLLLLILGGVDNKEQRKYAVHYQ